MKKLRSLGVVMCLLLLAPAISAETAAIAVRHQSELETAQALASLVEQGAMDHLFAAGHIVFDLDLDHADPVYEYMALIQARDGGAEFVIVLDLAFGTLGARGDVPVRVDVTVLDSRSGDELGERTLHAEQLETYHEMTADTIAVRLGGWAAQIALESIGGGDTGW